MIMSKKTKVEVNMPPHIGKMIEKKVKESGKSKASIAAMLGVSPIGFARYFEQSSVQFRILWKISIALKHNFLAELIDYLPQETRDQSQSNFQKTIESQAQEIADLKKEIAIYKSILAK